MSYANNNGVKIHYKVEGQGPPLVLQHGLTSDLTSWKQYGYTDALREENKLILIDARGHGRSDKPHEAEAYTPENMTGDVVAVLDDLGMEKAGYWGYSMGSMTGYRLLKTHPLRFTSLVLGGMSPYPHQSKEERAFWELIKGATKVGAQKGADAVISAFEKSGTVMDEPWKQRWRGVDWRAVDAACKGIIGWPSVEDTLASCSKPCLLYAGTLDPFSFGARRGAGEMRSATFVSIPGLDHSGAFDYSSSVLPHVKRFLSKIT
jgi:pimeloyl-ACP methyl ester carboxylesterase